MNLPYRPKREPVTATEALEASSSSEIQTQTQRLDDAASALNEGLELLAKRIAPVMRPGSDTANVKGCAPTAVIATELGGKLNAQSEIFFDIAARLNAMAERVEL